VVDEIIKYFPDLSDLQSEKLSGLKELYMKWNCKINVISRNDIENFYIHHLLHSLAIAKVFSFVPGSGILDAGTGGGFPGIPVSILFPDSEFTLLDSIEKKIKVVNAVSKELALLNVKTVRSRIEEHKAKYDFVVSRAVTAFPEFVRLTSKNIRIESKNNMKNGIIYLKGGDLTEELFQYREKIKVWDIKDFFKEPFFETKRIVYLPI
jgi:16S rRNA (guanine527-N7)-methyltransferase